MKNILKYCKALIFTTCGVLGSIIVTPIISLLFIVIIANEAWYCAINKDT